MGNSILLCGCLQKSNEPTEALIGRIEHNSSISNNRQNKISVQQNSKKQINNSKEQIDKSLPKMIFESLPKRETTELLQFKEILKNKTNNLYEKDKAYVLFLWVCDNIIYDADAYFAGRKVDCEPEPVFRKGITVCSGYARLYQNIGQYIGLQIECVSCYSKGVGFELVNTVAVGLYAIVAVSYRNVRYAQTGALVGNKADEVIAFLDDSAVDAYGFVFRFFRFFRFAGIDGRGRIFEYVHFGQPVSLGGRSARVVEGQQVSRFIHEGISAGQGFENIVLRGSDFGCICFAVGFGKLALVGINLSVVVSCPACPGCEALYGVGSFAVKIIDVRYFKVGPFGAVVAGRKHPGSAYGGGGKYFLFGAGKDCRQSQDCCYQFAVFHQNWP